MTFLLASLKQKGVSGLPVHFVGKAATMNLLYALPLLLLGTFDGATGRVAHIFGWAFLIWAMVMYWYGAFLYLVQVRKIDWAHFDE